MTVGIRAFLTVTLKPLSLAARQCSTALAMAVDWLFPSIIVEAYILLIVPSYWSAATADRARGHQLERASSSGTYRKGVIPADASRLVKSWGLGPLNSVASLCFKFPGNFRTVAAFDLVNTVVTTA